MDITAKIVELLVGWGPGGAVAALFYMAYRQEKTDHKDDVEKLEKVVSAKDLLIVDTLNKSNEAIDRAGERMAGLVEKSAAHANTMQNVINLLERQK